MTSSLMKGECHESQTEQVDATEAGSDADHADIGHGNGGVETFHHPYSEHRQQEQRRQGHRHANAYSRKNGVALPQYLAARSMQSSLDQFRGGVAAMFDGRHCRYHGKVISFDGCQGQTVAGAMLDRCRCR